MTNHSSASLRVETPHETETTQITINPALRHRAQAVINDTSIDPQWRTLKDSEDQATREKIEALVDIICGTGGAQAAGALFVLMGTIQNSTEAEALAHTAKHFAFTRCGDLNLFGMVDAQLAVVEGELLSHHVG